MKRTLILIVVVAILAVGAYFLLTRKNKAVDEPKPDPIAIGANSGTFNESFDQMLKAYYNLKDALVASDTAKASATASLLLEASDSLKLDEITGDSTGTIKSLASDLSGTVSGSCKALVAETSLENKRKEFQMISTAMWDLIRTARYAGQKVYKLYCPMAFDNTGAEWLSNQSVIQNPYFGEKMLTCGSVEDSLDYSKQ